MTEKCKGQGKMTLICKHFHIMTKELTHENHIKHNIGKTTEELPYPEQW